MITELLLMTDRMRAAAMTRGETGKLAELAKSEGMETLFENGMRKVADGVTTVEEILRATLQGGA
jgi:general secretion pathway protein E